MTHSPPQSTREFVTLLKEKGELKVIDDVIDPHLELAELHKEVVHRKGPALLFTNVKGCRFPVATNLYGSHRRIDLAFGQTPIEVVKLAQELAHQLPPKPSFLWNRRHLLKKFLNIGTKKTQHAPLLESFIPQADASQLPQIKCHEHDGGAFITLPLVHSQGLTHKKPNLGMYRIQLFDKKTVGLHFQIHRGIGFHYHEYESQNQSMPVHIYVGGPPALTLSAIAPLPEDVPEFIFASLVLNKKLKMTSAPQYSPLPFVSDADFCVVGDCPPHERRPEGPFGDHYGYYSLQHDYPFVNVKHIFHRKDAIYPATIVGRPPQEDHFLACYLQDLLKPMIELVMPQVTSVWAFEESGVHSLAGAVVKNRYRREALTTALRILGEGQLSLSKVLLVTDQNINVRDLKSLLTTILERTEFASDLFILSHISQDTLDYTTKTINYGSKMIWLGLGEKKRELPENYSGEYPAFIQEICVFCPGVLAVKTFSYAEEQDIKNKIAELDTFKNWPLIVILDSPKEACQSSEDFMWHVFTRFEPARDITAQEVAFKDFHAELTPPVVIDCRKKSWYPDEVTSHAPSYEKIKPLLNKYSL